MTTIGWTNWARTISEAAVGLVDHWTERRDQILSDLETSSDGKVSTGDCLTLWSYLGQLLYLEGNFLSRTTLDLRERLLRLLGSQKKKLVTCLEAGVDEVLSNLDREVSKTEHLYSRGELTSSLNQVELNYRLLSPRDALGYVELLSSSLSLKLQTDLVKNIQAEEVRLKELLPKAVQQFRESQDDPTPHPDRFP